MSRRLLLALALSLWATRAHADEDLSDLDPRVVQMANTLSADARLHFIAGYRAFNAKDYKTASKEIETAYKLDPEVPLLYTWALQEKAAGNCARAVDLFQKYLYSDISKPQADAARKAIDDCGGVPGVEPKAELKAEPVIDAPGGYKWYRDKPADALAAGGVVGLLIGTVYFVKAGRSASAAAGAFYLDDHDRLRSDATHQRNIGIGATVIGGVLAGAGVALWVYHSRNANVTTDGNSVAFAMRF